jgi:hypothetical protein
LPLKSENLVYRHRFLRRNLRSHGHFPVFYNTNFLSGKKNLRQRKNLSAPNIWIVYNIGHQKNLRIRKKLRAPNIWIIYNIGRTKISSFGNQNFGRRNCFRFSCFIILTLRIQKICSENTAGICFITSGPGGSTISVGL